MEELRAIRPFIYNGKNYSTGQLFLAPPQDAALLIAKRCAERVSIAPGTPVTKIESEPIEAETKEFKVSKVSKPKRK
jgi:hypothetical protein